MASRFVRPLNLACCFLTFFLLPVAIIGQTPPDNNEKISLEAVIDAWKRREGRVSTFDFMVAGTEFKRATTISEQGIIMGGQLPKQGPVSLPDLTTPVKIRLVTDSNGRARLDHNSTQWSAEKNGYVPSAATDIFDGKIEKVFIPYGTQEHPFGCFGEGAAKEIALNIRFLPVGMVYRPLDKAMGLFDSSKLLMTPTRAVVDQRPCIILKHGEDTLWVDPARDFVPVRWYEIYHGITVISIEIKYSSDPQHGWVPTSWNCAHMSPKGEVRESITCKVTHYDINKPISDETFDIEYPPGTWVDDAINNETYIVREGGKRRPILPGEFDGTNFQQLLHSDPPSRWGVTVLVVANVGILLAIIAVGVYYRRLKKAKISKSEIAQ